MARVPVPRPYNGGTWTESRMKSFIKGALRQASNRWGPKLACLKDARVERGVYKCVGYKQRSHNVPVSILHNGKRVKNVSVDHIEPVVDPNTGFTTWDSVIGRMFVEKEGLQVLCKECHARKTADERKARYYD